MGLPILWQSQRILVVRFTVRYNPAYSTQQIVNPLGSAASAKLCFQEGYS